jgi:UDP-glucose 4-epimerase
MINNKIDIPEKWLITGGCGFIGTSLIQRLAKNKHIKQIRVLDNLSVGTKDDLRNIVDFCDYSNLKDEGIFLKIGDIMDNNLCIEVSKNIDCIIHLAANTGVPQSVKNPRLDMETNVVGTVNMLEAARINGISKFIFASSGAPVGEIEPPIHEEIAPHPVSPYGASKLAGEGYCSSYYKTFGVNTIALRFGNVYGPGSKHKSSVVAKFIKNVLDKLVCEIYGDGCQTRDFIFVLDLIDAIVKASSLKIGGEIFQIASGNELTILELAEILKDLFFQLDYNMEFNFGAKRNGDVMRNYSDTSKAQRLLSWQPKTDFKKGLLETINWFIIKNQNP